MNITKEDKQLELLRWHQDCLDHYKGLRFQIPVLIITIQLSAFAFIVKDLAEGGKLETGLGLLLVSLISAIGLRALYLVRGQYRSISEDMDHLREKLAMDGLDYFAEGRGSKNDRKYHAPEIFHLGYAAISLVGACIIITQVLLTF